MQTALRSWEEQDLNLHTFALSAWGYRSPQTFCEMTLCLLSYLPFEGQPGIEPGHVPANAYTPEVLLARQDWLTVAYCPARRAEHISRIRCGPIV